MSDGILTDRLAALAARRRFGMRPGLEAIRAVCAALGNPHECLRGVVHIAGTNGKGAVAAMLDAALRVAGRSVGRYTSPHLMRLNERFFLDGAPAPDEVLRRHAERVDAVASEDLTFFEALTAVAFALYAEANCDHVVLETGLGGRLDATNVCRPSLCVITRIGLDHCAWLGGRVEQIAAEKAGIVKPGVPVVLGRNAAEVRSVVEVRAREAGAPFYYAPELADEAEIPSDFALGGTFNRENAVTALAALKVLGLADSGRAGFGSVAWPGRFQRIGSFLVDGAHNPPAARALAEALAAAGLGGGRLTLVAGFCGDKDVDGVLRPLAPFVARALAVTTSNPRALTPEEAASAMRAAGLVAEPCATLREALARSGGRADGPEVTTLVCGSLFLAGEALSALGVLSGGVCDPSERLVPQSGDEKP